MLFNVYIIFYKSIVILSIPDIPIIKDVLIFILSCAKCNSFPVIRIFDPESEFSRFTQHCRFAEGFFAKHSERIQKSPAQQLRRAFSLYCFVIVRPVFRWVNRQNIPRDTSAKALRRKYRESRPDLRPPRENEPRRSFEARRGGAGSRSRLLR